MSQLDFLPATFSPVNVNKESDIATVNFADFIAWFNERYSYRPSAPFDTEACCFRYDVGLDNFKSSFFYFRNSRQYDAFYTFFLENADMPICYADEFPSFYGKERCWLIDVYSGTVKLFFPNTLREQDAHFLFNYGRDIFFVRESSIMYDDFNRKEEFIYNLKTVYDDDGNCYYVPKCHDDEYYYCENCGELVFSKDDFIVTDDGSVFCSSDCAVDCEYSQCDHCGKWTSVDNTIYVENVSETYCEDCVEERCHVCCHCETVYDYRANSDSIETVDGDYFCCYECAEYEDVRCCDSCGEWMHIDSLNYSEYSERWLCNSCYDETEDIPRVIHDYGYKPSYRFNATPEENGQKNLYFGMEIETEFDKRDDFISALNSLDSISSNSNEQIYLKHDGSLSNYGVEIVTMPCTLDYVKSDEGAEVLKDVFHELSFANPSSDAGTHVHISRAGFTSDMCICLELFFMRAAELCQAICGRGSVHYAQYDMERDVENLEQFEPYYCDSRYRCVNWNNSRTVEIRAFSAITTIEEYYKNLEFCHAVYQYVKAGEIEFFQYGDVRNSFISYVEKNKERYPYLFEFISENVNN